jgi:hypothetical protein
VHDGREEDGGRESRDSFSNNSDGSDSIRNAINSINGGGSSNRVSSDGDSTNINNYHRCGKNINR